MVSRRAAARAKRESAQVRDLLLEQAKKEIGRLALDPKKAEAALKQYERARKIGTGTGMGRDRSDRDAR